MIVVGLFAGLGPGARWESSRPDRSGHSVSMGTGFQIGAALPKRNPAAILDTSPPDNEGGGEWREG
jgi:hypothetical protein